MYLCTRPTLFLLAADCTTQHELYQLSQFCDISHLSYQVHVWHMFIRHLVTEHLFTKQKSELVGSSQAAHEK